MSLLGNLGWRFGGLAARAALQFTTFVVLSRLLPVADFGAVTYAMIFVNLTEMLVQFGIGPAVIQKKSLDRGMIRSGFTISIAAGFVGSLGLLFIAPLVAGSSQTGQVLQLLAPVFLLTSLGAVSEALLHRAGRFREFVLAELSAAFAGYSLVTIGLALLGFGIYSLIAGVLMQAALRSVLFWLRVRHPLMPAFRPGHVRSLARFGGGLTVSRLLNFAATNGDYFIAGRLLGETQLGLYSRAFYLMRFPTDMITVTLHTVLFPAFAEKQDDPAALRSLYLQAVRMSAALTLPMMAVLYFLAPFLVPLLLGDNWRGAILPLQILVPVGFLNLYSLSDALLKARGEIRRQMAGHAMFATVLITGAYFGASDGIPGIAVAVLAANILMYAYMGLVSIRLLEIPLATFVAAQLPAFILGAAGAAGAVAAGQFMLPAATSDAVAVAAIAVAAGAAIGGAGVLPLPMMRELREDVIRVLQRAIASKRQAP